MSELEYSEKIIYRAPQEGFIITDFKEKQTIPFSLFSSDYAFERSLQPKRNDELAIGYHKGEIIMVASSSIYGKTNKEFRIITLDKNKKKTTEDIIIDFPMPAPCILEYQIGKVNFDELSFVEQFENKDEKLPYGLRIDKNSAIPIKPNPYPHPRYQKVYKICYDKYTNSIVMIFHDYANRSYITIEIWKKGDKKWILSRIMIVNLASKLWGLHYVHGKKAIIEKILYLNIYHLECSRQHLIIEFNMDVEVNKRYLSGFRVIYLLHKEKLNIVHVFDGCFPAYIDDYEERMSKKLMNE